ncbi:type II secretion system protein GspD [Campylobacter sputorum]|uniref:type II secretion system protein GspD n=1 Tax=Campylobacter sputorum TaxID=206 RepID=UPI00053BEC6C|nr:hypothetical protein [Campylobacter sputorum]
MKQIFLTLILILAVLSNLAYSKDFKTNIYEYAKMVSDENKVKILVNADINSDDFTFYTYENEPIPKIEVFKKIVELQGLKLLKVDDFYFVYDPFSFSKRKNKKSNNKDNDFISMESYFGFDDNSTDNNATDEFETKENLYYVKLKNNSFNEINELLAINFDKNATYIAKDNSVAFTSTAKQYSEILEAINSFDEKKLNQVTFKIIILETNLDDLKDKGTNLNSLFKGVNRQDFNLFVNLITMPFTQETNILQSKKDGFYGVVSFLDKNKITEIKSSPILTAKNNTQVYFSNVTNIPYLVNQSSYTSSGTSNQNSYEYRDVGLKMWIKPVIIGNNVDFDLKLIFDNVVDDTSDLLPRTSKKELNSNYSLKRGNMLVLGGINQVNKIKYTSGIHILKDIWLLKYLFSMNTEKITNSVLTISIEVN